MNNNRAVYDIFDEVFESNKEFRGTIVEQHIKKLRDLDEFLPPSCSFFILTNTTQNNYPFVSKNFIYNLGLDIDRMNNEGVPYWFSHIHPDDIAYWVKGMKDLMIFTMTQIKSEDRPRISYTWNVRARKHDGNYVNLFEHQTPILLDSNDKPVVGIGHLTVTGEGAPMPIKVTAKILNKNNEYETLYLNTFGQRAITEGLTHRELDIVRLLALQKTSKEIAEKLFISSHTVDTHRRNIIKKLNLNSTGEIIAYAKQNLLF